MFRHDGPAGDRPASRLTLSELQHHDGDVLDALVASLSPHSRYLRLIPPCRP